MSGTNVNRVAARFVDLAIAFGLAFALTSGWNDIVVGLAFVLLAALLEIIPLALYGATIGKALLGLRVRTHSGEPLDVGLAAERTLMLWLLLAWAIAETWIPGPRHEPKFPFGKEPARWDEICDTTVVDLWKS